MAEILEQMGRALAARAELLAACEAEGTDCLRLFHGTVEGLPGLTVDRYGNQLLIQSFHRALADAEIASIRAYWFAAIAALRYWAYHDRSGAHSRIANISGNPATGAQIGKELGVSYRVETTHAGQDPLLFLDMRAGRRWMKANAQGKSVLNLFAYTCGIGVAAAVGGASEVWNVDFAESALAIGQENALLNQVDKPSTRFIQSDCFAALYQLSGIGIPQRSRRLANGKRVPISLPPYPTLPQRQFDLVFLDPPRFAKSKFGTVDLVRDYQGLFKPALLATKPGGTLIACNNVAQVDQSSWLDALTRCANKANRPISIRQILPPESDFPSFDNNPPLKIAIFDT